MEQVHKTYRRPWISQEINIRQFRDAAYSVLAMRTDLRDELDFTLNERLLRIYGNELPKREAACSLSVLDCEGEEYIEYSKDFEPPEDNNLETLRRQAQEMEKRNLSTTYRNMVFQTCRYRHLNSSMDIVPARKKSADTKTEFVPVNHPEVVITVQVYRPEKQQVFHHHLTKSSRTPTFTVEQQFLVLGSQCLTEVRDLILCQSDASVAGEFSEDPSAPINYKCQEVYKSGFFYINGTFYNDMRDPFNKDYSSKILEWSVGEASDVGPFSVAKMEDTHFIDLEIQLGLPYVYMHQGHCEHMLVFSEMRLMSSKDPQNLLEYPLVQIVQSKKPVNCMVCMLYTARWITMEDSRLPELPYFFCEKCFQAFNYDIKGNKIADFKAYKYCDRTAIF